VIGETLILQAGDYGRYVGRLDLTIDSDTDTITDYTYTLMPVNLKKRVKYHDKSYYMYVDKGYVEDPTVLEFIQPYLEQTDDLLSQPVGETLVDLVGIKEIIRSQETNLANLVTDSIRTKTGAEIAFYNAGGIRADIAAGPIAYRDILTVLPFGNTLVVLDMTGEQILALLNYAATMKPGNGGFLHTSGLTWTNNRGIPENVMVAGVPLEFERMYKVVTNSFLAMGGDGYTMFKDLPQYDTGFVDASTLRDYIQKAGKVAPKVEGRLTIIE
jgi:5'-nucleotidase/UDP-sugar diphosphatase